MDREMLGVKRVKGDLAKCAADFLEGELISYKEAARRKGVSVQTIRRHVALGHLRTFHGTLFIAEVANIRLRGGQSNNRKRNSHRDAQGRYQAYKTDDDMADGV